MRNATIIMIVILSLVGASCATLEKEKETELKTEERKEEKTEKEVEKEKFEAITGVIVPVDDQGIKIEYQDKDRILVRLIPIMDGKKLLEDALAFNPRPDGRFIYKLDDRAGDRTHDRTYAVEIFLEGFYIKSFEITINKNEILDLGVINIKRIETDIGTPLKEEKTEDVVIDEGDVNIEPPSM